MKPERLPDEQIQRWRDAQHKVQRAQLEANAARLALEVAQLAVQRLSLDFAEETLIAEIMADAPPELEGAA